MGTCRFDSFNKDLLLNGGPPVREHGKCYVGPRFRSATVTMVLGASGFPACVINVKDRHLQGRWQSFIS